MVRIRVGILLFNEVEVMDFAGPFEVFSITEDLGGSKLFEVKTIAASKEMVCARNGLKVMPDYGFNDAPEFNMLIVPGGYGAEEIEIHNRETIDWIRSSAVRAQITASVCTGAFLLAEAGLLDGRAATTHWMDIDKFETCYPKIKVVRGVKYVDACPMLTSGGISAGINMAFYILRKLYGAQIARNTARRMEYDIDLECC